MSTSNRLFVPSLLAISLLSNPIHPLKASSDPPKDNKKVDFKDLFKERAEKLKDKKSHKNENEKLTPVVNPFGKGGFKTMGECIKERRLEENSDSEDEFDDQSPQPQFQSHQHMQNGPAAIQQSPVSTDPTHALSNSNAAPNGTQSYNGVNVKGNGHTLHYPPNNTLQPTKQDQSPIVMVGIGGVLLGTCMTRPGLQNKRPSHQSHKTTTHHVRQVSKKHKVVSTSK